MLIKGLTFTENIPHEPDHSITFRRLSGRELAELGESRMKKMLATYADYMGKLPDVKRDAREDVEEYDKFELLQKAIVGWSYPEEVTPENIDLLDIETVNWAYQVIIHAHKQKTKQEKKAG